MDLLETQVSDLRSFLVPGTGTGTGTGGPGHGPGSGSGSGSANLLGTAASPAANKPSQHSSPQSQQHFHAPGANVSAPYGDNSAHNSNSPISPPGSGSQSHHDHSSVNSRSKRSAPDPNSDDGGPGGSATSKQQRAKRNRYISIACNECKRRKIKCNGQNPCQRCGHLNLQCLYSPNCCTNNFKDSDEYRHMNEQVGRLQEQVDNLIKNLNALRQETLRLAPIQSRILPLPSNASTPTPSIPSVPPLPKPVTTLRVPPSFSGPTSPAFTVDVAKNTLHNMGYTGGDGSEENGANHEPTPHASPSIIPQGRSSPNHAADPLWNFSREEMIELCKFHEDEVGIMYPVVKMDSVVEHAKKLSSWMDSAKRHGLTSSQGQDGGISDHQTLILKIVMCCALTVLEHGRSARAEQLYETIQPIVDKMLMSDPADVTKLPFLALVGGYRFLANEEVLAWRVMGHVARLCFELGLHRREGLERIPDAQNRRNALNTFWTAYVLDRRWGFGTGLPFVCHDDKIDPGLPLPDEYPYLVAMITYSKLGAKIWKLVDYFEPALIRELKPQDVEALDREILDWYETVPEAIKVRSLSPDQIPVPSGENYNLQRLQVWTRLRLNQMRTWLHTPVLHSASSIVENMYLAQKTVGFAKETIRYLTQLNKTTRIYHRMQTFYHQFLTSAISVLFLASTHAPLQFSGHCRGEFYMALDLVRDMSARSWVSQRLWKTIRSLKAYAPRLGLEEDGIGGADRGMVMGQQGPGVLLGMGGIVQGLHQGQGMGHGQGQVGSPGGGGGGYGGYTPGGGGSGGGGSNVSTPTPTPGHQQQQQHQQQNQNQNQNQQWVDENLNNGLRLQTEMSKIYEEYTGFDVLPSLQTLQRSHILPGAGPVAGEGAMQRGGVSPGDGGGGGSSVGMASPASGTVVGVGVGVADQGVGVYQQLRDMF